MKIQKLKNYILTNFTEEQIKIGACLFISFFVSVFIYSLQNQTKSNEVPKDLQVNLSVMIPNGYILYPFETANFENVEPLLEAYNIVQIYNPLTGRLLAENIKMLRAPKNPAQLAFVIPTDIARKLAPFGLEFKIAIQKYANREPTWMLKKNKIKTAQKLVTFGG